VVFDSIDKDGTVTYELILEELCSDPSPKKCQDQAQDTLVYYDVTDYMLDEIDSGSFTRTLRLFARKCDDKDCDGIRGASVEDGTFGNEETEVIIFETTRSPTSLGTEIPTTAPTMSPTFIIDNPTLFPIIDNPTLSPIIDNPTTSPTTSSTADPTTAPTTFPTTSPTAAPSTFPTFSPVLVSYHCQMVSSLLLLLLIRLLSFLPLDH